MATNQYTTQAISGFNSSPPGDDGAAVAANQLEWQKHLDKIGVPVRNLAQGINTQALAAFGTTINNNNDDNYAMGGSLAFTESELTISSGSVTATRSAHTIDTESDAASDDLSNIGTGSVSNFCILHIRADNTGRTVVVKDAAGGAGQIHLADNLDYTLDDNQKSLTLQRRGADWYEIARDSVGVVKQIVATQTGAVSTGTTLTPDDDTIPAITEGDEYMTRTITPRATNSRLLIKVTIIAATSVSGGTITAALHQDSITDALAAAILVSSANAVNIVDMGSFSHEMQAGTTSQITFRVRIGSDQSGTITFNGRSAGRLLGGIMASSIVITEYAA